MSLGKRNASSTPVHSICGFYTVTVHRGNASLVMTVLLVTYGVSRYLLLVTVDSEGEGPEKLLVTDRIPKPKTRIHG